MKVKEIFSLAASLLGESAAESRDLEPFIPGWVGFLAAEALDVENALRRAAGREPLPNAPVPQALEDDIDYDPRLVRLALPYGLAALLYEDDQNDYRAQHYRARFVGALWDAMRLTEERIADLYADGEEG